MATGKKLGFKKGDFVHTGAFPGILISDIHTETPIAEVWGFEHEAGSVYANDLKLVTFDEFATLCRALGHSDLNPFAKEAKAAIAQATGGQP